MMLRTKLVLTATIVTAGTAVALCFRKPLAQPPAPPQAEALPLRGQEATAPMEKNNPPVPQGVPLPTVRPGALAASGDKSSHDIFGLKPSLTAPPLPPAFQSEGPSRAPAAPPLPDLRGGTVSSAPPPATEARPQPVSPGHAARSAEPPRWRSHTVVDGDTLSSLATRYLGSAGRFAELLAANRNVLPSSDMLPIGVVIRIPPAESAAIPSVAEKSQEEDNRFRHLVPIPSGALSP